MTSLDERINAQTERLLRLERQRAIKEYAAKEKERKAQRKVDADARKADAHRKITLGGLVIASEVDDWNPAEIVGALLYARHKLATPEGATFREKFRDAGIAQLEAREASRKAGK